MMRSIIRAATLALTVASSAHLFACQQASSAAASPPKMPTRPQSDTGELRPREPYYQVLLVSQSDPSSLERYRGMLEAAVRAHGGTLQRKLAPVSVYADGVAKPDLVNVVQYASLEELTAATKGDQLRGLGAKQGLSVKSLSLEGPSSRGQLSATGAEKRLYLLEIARFGSGGLEGYRRYEEQAEPIMAAYGYHVERVIEPASAEGLPFEPDIVKIAYFETPEQMQEMEKDPAHSRIEQELYPAAVAESIWIIARPEPTQLAP